MELCSFWGINVEIDPEYMSRSAEEEYVEGVEDDVESKYEPDHEEQLCPCDTASEKNLLARFSLELQHINLQLCLLKGISKKLSNIKRMIRNKIAPFLLHLSATLSKVMELCSLDIP